MFGFGKKKKLDEFTAMLAEFGNISEKEARAYVDKNQIEIKAAFGRGLDATGALMYISDNQMERIFAAHQIEELDLVKDIPDFWLLVCLQSVVAMEAAGISSEQLNFNFKYWNKVIKIETEGVLTYDEKLKMLVEKLNSKK